MDVAVGENRVEGADDSGAGRVDAYDSLGSQPKGGTRTGEGGGNDCDTREKGQQARVWMRTVTMDDSQREDGRALSKNGRRMGGWQVKG